MRADEVPQDAQPGLDGHTRAIYARDVNGDYGRVESSGWEAESTATHLAIADFERGAADAVQRCRAGTTAPLEHHMYARRMDVPALADATGMARWRVRRHLRPRVFARLSTRLLARYAEALQLPAETLRQLPTEP